MKFYRKPDSLSQLSYKSIFLCKFVPKIPIFVFTNCWTVPLLLLNMAYTYKYPRPAVTADCVVITESEPQVLLIERGDAPYQGHWAIPGGFLNMDETTEQCAKRELEEETGLKIEKVHQIGAYSKVDRDPRGRTISVAYLAIVDKPIEVSGQDDAANARWFSLNALPLLAFDHDEIMEDAITLYDKLKKTKVDTMTEKVESDKE